MCYCFPPAKRLRDVKPTNGDRGLSDSRCSIRNECNFTRQIHSVTCCTTWPSVRCGFFDQSCNLFRSGNVDGSLFPLLIPLLVARGKLHFKAIDVPCAVVVSADEV
jgi:hypothetical protein